jgi:hypothetical protein
MQVTTVGIDLAKNVFQLHGCDATGKAVLRKQLARRRLLGFVANLPRCLVAMEACASAHYWAREIEKLGHEAGRTPSSPASPRARTLFGGIGEVGVPPIAPASRMLTFDSQARDFNHCRSSLARAATASDEVDNFSNAGLIDA